MKQHNITCAFSKNITIVSKIISSMRNEPLQVVDLNSESQRSWNYSYYTTHHGSISTSY